MLRTELSNFTYAEFMEILNYFRANDVDVVVSTNPQDEFYISENAFNAQCADKEKILMLNHYEPRNMLNILPEDYLSKTEHYHGLYGGSKKVSRDDFLSIFEWD